jgi:response regulator RpfG family c-di-GMP phosphodiesterase
MIYWIGLGCSKPKRLRQVFSVFRLVHATSPTARRPGRLVVDDEPQITRVLRTSLAGSGYEARTADDGHAGLRSAREWQPDLVITDFSMLNMSCAASFVRSLPCPSSCYR